jgi:hypothetical protein
MTCFRVAMTDPFPETEGTIQRPRRTLAAGLGTAELLWLAAPGG